MGEVVASKKLYLFVQQRAIGRIECRSLIANLLLVAGIKHVSQIKQISKMKQISQAKQVSELKQTCQ